MTIAAVPSYLGNEFKHASPSLRFGMYLKVWNKENFKKSKPSSPKDNLLVDVCGLNNNDRATIEAIRKRQHYSFSKASKCISTDALQIDAISTSPITTGLGNEHPLENGFAFLNPFGLPYLPGSGVKGVLRQAVYELAKDKCGESEYWDGEGKQVSDILFGNDDSNNPHQGALTFWDVIPEIKGNKLSIEIMTPHYGHYYQGSKEAEINSPHDSGTPVPISFLAIPPDSGFTFHILCNLNLLKNRNFDLLGDNLWKNILQKAFEHAFTWLGFGAKTTLGYGAMEEDQKKKVQREAEERKKEDMLKEKEEKEQREKELPNMNEIDREWYTCLDNRSKGQLENNAIIECLEKREWSKDISSKIAEKLKEKMKKEKKWREVSNKKNPDKDKDHMATKKVMKYLPNN